MSSNTVTRIIFLSGVLLVAVSNILDALPSNLSEKQEENGNDSAQRNCACNDVCMCCVELNFTYVDLGGPACVQLKYISKEEGIAVNISYGESLIHSQRVKGPNPEPTCTSLLGNLAQICARFTDLHPTNDGLRGCVLLEPKLLGEFQTQFNIGCFNMGPDGIKFDSSLNNTTEENANANETQIDPEGLNEEELIAAVNESAQQGLVFFGNLLGLAFGNTESNTTISDDVNMSSTEIVLESTEASQSIST